MPISSREVTISLINNEFRLIKVFSISLVFEVGASIWLAFKKICLTDIVAISSAYRFSCAVEKLTRIKMSSRRS